MTKNQNEFLEDILCDVSNQPLMSFSDEQKLVRIVARQYQHQGLTLQQLVDAGNKGLETAVRQFNPASHLKFNNYAVWWIRMSILEALAEASRGEAQKGADGTLTHREEFIITRLFGIGCEKMPLEEIANEWNITGERVRQIAKRALMKMNGLLTQ